jgi:hypothetical protein
MMRNGKTFLKITDFKKKVKFNCGIGALKSALAKVGVEPEAFYIPEKCALINFYEYSPFNLSKLQKFFDAKYKRSKVKSLS